MPRREDIRTIMVLGSGPIVIGQAGEFDYSGTQGCRALRDEGYRIVLVNSNPATIMTDPGVADRTYVEPLDVEAAERIIQAEQPDAILPTLGGQTALNLAIDLAESGVLERHGVELIGADVDVIQRAEDRDLFKDCMRFGHVVRDSTTRHVETNFNHCLLELVAVFCCCNCFCVSANELWSSGHSDKTLFIQRHCKVETRLTAKSWQYRIWLLSLNDLGKNLRSERFDVRAISKVRVGHDGGRV